ncbi:hypothetical protein QG37_08299 [Candidozyma auris]|nr:hypothetical protein QG37_08299 [[Candida] auris]
MNEVGRSRLNCVRQVNGSNFGRVVAKEPRTGGLMGSFFTSLSVASIKCAHTHIAQAAERGRKKATRNRDCDSYWVKIILYIGEILQF